MAIYYHAAGLTPGVTYYWRVDETAADGTVATGPVWSFTAVHVAAYSPSPADGGVWQRNDTTISWKARRGRFPTKCTAAPEGRRGRRRSECPPGHAGGNLLRSRKLAPLTVYYWRVDEVDPTGATSRVPSGASTWSARTPEVGKRRRRPPPGFLRTYVADGLYDIGTFGDEMTYEFIVRSNPDETQASQCLLGVGQGGDTQMRSRA